MQEYNIYVGSDHRGFEKKRELLPILDQCHGNVHAKDCGPEKLDPEDDFNDAAIAVSSAVLGDDHSFGVLLCGSAHGVTMQANRFKGIRAIHASTPESSRIGREHDHANVLCLSADELSVDEMERIVKAFCHARPNMAEKYTRRVERLDRPVEGMA